jgi:hypothetical protein
MAAREWVQKELKLFFICNLAFAANLHIDIADEHGAPVWTRLEVRDSTGKMYQPKVSIHEEMKKTRGGKPFYLGSFIVNGSADLEVPEAHYTIIAEHGTEYERAERQVDAPASVRIILKPWIRMRAKGWWSGDMHVHHSLEDAPGIAQAEDLNFIVLANRGKQDLMKHWPAEETEKVSDNYWMTLRNAEDERRGGSWIFNNLRAPLMLGREGGWFPQGLDYVRQARAQGVWFDIDMPFWWEVPVMVALGHPDSIDILHNQFMQYGIDQSEYWGRPRDRNKFPGWQGFVDYSMELYYRYLNLGYKIPPSAGTGTGVMPNPAGYDRVYAKVDGPFTVDKWYQAIREGRSFVTNGPMLFVTYKNGQIDVKAEAREPIDRIELVANGRIIERIAASTARFHIDREKYSWCAVRCFLKTPDNIRLAHSTPIYLNGKWDARKDAAYFMSWLDELILQTNADPKRFENDEQRDAVLAIYGQAREIFIQASRGQ